MNLLLAEDDAIVRRQAALSRGMEAGADDFITKPVDVDELRARLKAAERILGLRRRAIQSRLLSGLL